MNGVKKIQPAGSLYISKEINKKTYLDTILSKLINEIGFIINSIQEINKTEPHIGFFPMVRILMPIIDATASALSIKPEDLLKRLGIGTPKLIWDLYRNNFSQNDEFILFKTVIHSY